MSIERFKTKGKHNVELACIKVLPKKEPKALIQIFHGMGEHKERYIPFMEFMAEQGYALYAHDHRKHGESITIEEGYGIFDKNDRWDDVLDDCYFVTRRMLKDFPGKPVIIFGHSMGSIIARAFISKNPLISKAAIIMGTLPPFSSSKAFAPLMLARVINLFSSSSKRSTFLAETLNKPMLKDYTEPRTKFDWLSRDEALVDAYIEDPLCGYAYTPKFYIEFFKAIVECNKTDFILKTKDIPILFISGEADPVGENGAGVERVHQMYNGHGYTQLTLKLVPEARHEVLNELDKEQTYNFIKDWCAKAL